jgi:hypothetical protein
MSENQRKTMLETALQLLNLLLETCQSPRLSFPGKIVPPSPQI